MQHRPHPAAPCAPTGPGLVVLGLLALPLGALAPLAGARPAAPQDAPPAAREAAEPDQPAKERVLTLAGGDHLRARTRCEDGVWSYFQDGEWTPLPVGAVTEVQSLSELTREWRKRQREAGDEPAARCAAARWALNSGLLQEGLEALDAELEARPLDADALAALAEAAPRVRVPQLAPEARADDPTVDALLHWCGTATRVGRELGFLELARLRDREGLEQRLVTDLQSPVVTRRTTAAHALGRLLPGHAVKPLLVHSVLDASESVRKDAAVALGQVREDSVAEPVVRALGSRSPRVRAQAAEALGWMDYPATVAPLVSALARAADGTAAAHSVPHSYIFTGRQKAYLQNFDVEVAQFQAVADPNVGVYIEGSVLDAGVRGVQEVVYTTTEVRAYKDSLRQLTGQKPGNSARSWERWWDDNKSAWTAHAQGADG